MNRGFVGMTGERLAGGGKTPLSKNRPNAMAPSGKKTEVSAYM
jgi:hypothetical protein